MYITERWKGFKNLKLLRLRNGQIWLVEQDIFVKDSETLAYFTFLDQLPPVVKGEFRIWASMVPVVKYQSDREEPKKLSSTSTCASCGDGD